MGTTKRETATQMRGDHNRRRFLQVAAGALSATPHAMAADQRPNILFLFPDQHRYDWTGANPENPVRTPHLDALSRRGVRFTRAVVASPLCAPSRACLAAGREYDRCGVPSNAHDYPLAQTTYYWLLRASGYHVAACGKLDLRKKARDWGLDGKRCLEEWGFSDGIDNAGKRDAVATGAETPKDPYMAYLHSRHLARVHVADFRSRNDYSATFPTPLPDDAYCDNWIAANGLELMRRFPKGKPWHLVVNFAGPHEPMDITRSMEGPVRGRRFPKAHANTQFDPEVHNTIRQNYAAMIENIDRWLGRYIDELKRRGELDNTIIVFSSDHGEMLGDHNRWGKTVPYQASVGVPLTIAGPGVRTGVVSDALVSIMDLAATFLDFAGVATPREMDNRSFKPLLKGRTNKHREVVRSGLGPWRMVSDGRYKLIRGFDPATSTRAGQAAAAQPADAPMLLFHLEADPGEDRNIAAASPQIVRRLQEYLTA